MARPQTGTAAERPSSERDVIPLYHRVYVMLLQKIMDGSYPQGSPIPSEDDLAETFSVSRVTIRKAMERLEREGRVLRQRGRGTFPLTPANEAGESASQLLNNQISLARKTKIVLLAYDFVRPSPLLAQTFDIADGTELLRIERVRGDERSPISHTLCYLPADLAPLVPRTAISSLPVSATLAAAGVKLARFEERITAVLADSDVAPHLDVAIGTPLVAMTRHVRDEDGRLIELLQALYRPDRYEYRVQYSIDGQNLGTPWKAMITDSGAA
ncbi:GntR family transcriptional regulator [Bosea sp. (in: a-proteobacteria)]|jgi:GntR family transcriptional regulator|uniref:GntR family transcriptional regulator n=1 Tax=Bosea sp. (in: a-proteobacteria) TaxID=1871050 RepID=UPI002DDCB873|nr:GntR family transcriptional regulator [Bosea sp. (in: a-proteobacteria)]HEV2511952.1 GntR family transcriptional regulator [Bosea sp. (in: a-proteobacteria)]